tara:strand:- start:13518 stop:13841 length:324 start_codon:yes stop_codon:yes gene_type:complete
MFIVVWIIFAFVTAAIAESKQRSVLGWFFVGLLFGIFAIIVIAVQPSLVPVEPVQQIVYAPHPGPAQQPQPTQSPIQALEQLGNLHQQGVITEAEFLTKKQELLNRV